MSNLSFPTFFAWFHQYSKKIRWNNIAQINYLVESLISDLKRTLIEVSLSNNLQDTTNLINCYYNNLMRLNSWKTYQSNIITTSTPASSKNPDIININTRNKSYALKNSPEQQKYIKKSHYFKYESKNYLSLKYFVLVFKKALRVTEISSSLISLSCSTSSGTVLLNEFFQS